MKLSVNKNILRDTVARLEKITGKNLSLPVLRCLLCVAENGMLTLRATNLDIGIEAHIPAKIKKEGTCAVPADIFHGLLSSMSQTDEVELEALESQLLVNTKHTSAHIGLFSAEDFPIVPKASDKTLFHLDIETLIAGLRSVVYAASTSTIKPELASVYLYPEGEYLVCVATDSFRLAEKRIPAKGIGNFSHLLVPIKNITELVRNLDGLTGEVVVSGDEHQIGVTCQEVYITSRVIDGTFPDYQQIIPQEHTTEVVVLKNDLQDALKVSRIFSDTFHKVSILVDTDTKQVSLTTHNSEVGENTTTLDAAITGEGVQINFNYMYIMDVFSALQEDSVTLRFNGTGKPLMIRGVGNGTFTYIVMPMNR